MPCWTIRSTMVGDALKDPADWCDILILPFNTKYCHAVDANGAAALHVRIGRKYDQPVEQAYRLDFALQHGRRDARLLREPAERAEGPGGHQRLPHRACRPFRWTAGAPSCT